MAGVPCLPLWASMSLQLGDHMLTPSGEHGTRQFSSDNALAGRPAPFERGESEMAIDWQTLLIPKVSLVELIIRGSVMYLMLFTLLRVLGRRHMGSLSLMDLLLIVLIADAAQNAMASNYRSLPGRNHPVRHAHRVELFSGLAFFYLLHA